MMHLADIAILLAFGVYVVLSGLGSRKIAGENLEQYFLAGRTLKGWQAGLSMAATQFAADTPLLVTGLIAVGGIFALWRLWIYAVSFLLIGFLLAACWRRANVLTDAEMVEKRYDGKLAAVLRGFKALYLGTAFNITVLAMVLLAACRIVEPFLTWNLWLPAGLFDGLTGMVAAVGVPLTLSASPDDPTLWVRSANNLLSLMAISMLTLVYSTTEGLRSVVRTDIVQFALMIAGTGCFAWLVITQVGGFDALYHKLSQIFNHTAPIQSSQLLSFTPFHAKDVTLAIVLVFSLQWLAQINADGSGYLAQRFMACRSEEDGRQAAIVFSFAQILLRSLLWLPIVLGLLVLFPPDFSLSGELYTAHAEATYVQGMIEILPPGVKGLMFTAMLAALASTVDTHLNWGASYWTNDLYRRFWCGSVLKKEPNPRTLVWVARLSNVCILGLAFVVMTQLTSIKTAWEISLLLGAATGIPLLLRWIWWRFNVWGEILPLAISLVAVPLLLFYLPGSENDGWRLLSLVVISISSSVVAAFLFKPEPMDRLVSFYREVKPPGFWGPVAKAAMETPQPAHPAIKMLWQGLSGTFLTTASLFCLLVGIGSMMFNSPAPPWWPVPWAWAPAVTIVGLVLTPFWIKHARPQQQSAAPAETPELALVSSAKE